MWVYTYNICFAHGFINEDSGICYSKEEKQTWILQILHLFQWKIWIVYIFIIKKNFLVFWRKLNEISDLICIEHIYLYICIFLTQNIKT
jgi:hypothetical protein